MKTYLVMVDQRYADARIYDVDEQGNTTEANEAFDTEVLLKRIEARTVHEALKSVAYSESLPVSYLKAYEVVPELPKSKYKSEMSLEKFIALANLVTLKPTFTGEADYLLTMEQAASLMNQESLYAYSLVEEGTEWMIKRMLIPNAIGYLLARRLVELGDGVVYW